MQYKIPQNVQIEDKIVGPLTLKQLIIAGAGGGVDYFIYVSLAKTHGAMVWLPPVAFFGILTASIAFVRLKGVSFTQYVLLTLEFYLKQRHRFWMQGGGEVFQSITVPKIKSKEQLEYERKQKKAPERNMSNLHDLIRTLDSQSTSTANPPAA